MLARTLPPVRARLPAFGLLLFCLASAWLTYDQTRLFDPTNPTCAEVSSVPVACREHAAAVGYLLVALPVVAAIAYAGLRRHNAVPTWLLVTSVVVIAALAPVLAFAFMPIA